MTIVVAFGIGVICGALCMIMVVKCCCSSTSGALCTEAVISQQESSVYAENWIYIVSDERHVYHLNSECSSTKRTSKSSFRWYRVCKICAGVAKPTMKKHK